MMSLVLSFGSSSLVHDVTKRQAMNKKGMTRIASPAAQRRENITVKFILFLIMMQYVLSIRLRNPEILHPIHVFFYRKNYFFVIYIFLCTFAVELGLPILAPIVAMPIIVVNLIGNDRSNCIKVRESKKAYKK